MRLDWNEFLCSIEHDEEMLRAIEDALMVDIKKGPQNDALKVKLGGKPNDRSMLSERLSQVRAKLKALSEE